MSQPRVQDQRWLRSLEPVPAHLRPVLLVLLSGITDAAACGRLHMSPRTFSRRLAELLDFFGVETRFQAGLALGMSCADPFPKPYAQKNAAPRRPRVAGRPDRTGP